MENFSEKNDNILIIKTTLNKIRYNKKYNR